MADSPDRPKGSFGVTFLILLVVGTVLFGFLLWSRGCDGDPFDGPEQLEVEDVTQAALPALEGWVA